jgi:hypothetical protein
VKPVPITITEEFGMTKPDNECRKAQLATSELGETELDAVSGGAMSSLAAAMSSLESVLHNQQQLVQKFVQGAKVNG